MKARLDAIFRKEKEKNAIIGIKVSDYNSKTPVTARTLANTSLKASLIA